MSDQGEQPEQLAQRKRGTHLPAAAYRAIGIAKVPDSRWSDDEPAIRLLLNGLRRWEPSK